MELWNTFEADRTLLERQYVDAWHNEAAYQRFDRLQTKVLALADSLEGEPAPVVKARCFAYILDHAPIYLNDRDWFGIAPEAQKMEKIEDVGCRPDRILIAFNNRQKKKLADSLHLPEDAHFKKYATKYLLNEFYIDYNHSTPNWEDLFALGIEGLLNRAREYRRRLAPLSAQQEAYFDGIEISYSAILRLFARYITALEGRTEPKLLSMRSAFTHLLHHPPQNTYEALLLSWQYWFLQENIDCMRARTMGGLDTLYLPFYQKDLQSGRFTKEQIRELFVYFMNAFYSIRVRYQQPMYLGGMDKKGNCTVNELSYLVLDAYNVLSAPNPKLQVKISANTPEPFLQAVLETIRNGNSSISIINDDVAAASLMRVGVPQEEARTCLMSGCWDYSVQYREVKTVPIRVSLPKLLEYTLTGGICLSTNEQVGLKTPTDFNTFADFYRAFEQQFLYVWHRSKRIIENWEIYLGEINPSNLFSATMTDSLAQGVDGYARGMKYNTTVYCMAGLGSLIDGLCAVKKFVFDRKAVSLPQMAEILKKDWKDHEALRDAILRDPDKYGNGSALADGLTVQFVDFVSAHINGAPNSRGGYWKLGTLSIDKNLRFGTVTAATVDGRKAGEPFSKNNSPVIGMDRGGITVLLNSLCKIDFSKFTHAGMLDLVLHPTAVEGVNGMNAFSALVRTYFAQGGHSMQFNIFSAAQLKKAQANPAQYRNLQIRVCGWNVYFVDLEKALQDAFIQQCEHNEGRN
ncbi:MAG: hypothetical protein IJP27_03820 [Clostridia bacterium]|nr:hypothetical protein [Clostridia bacterium]